MVIRSRFYSQPPYKVRKTIPFTGATNLGAVGAAVAARRARHRYRRLGVGMNPRGGEANLAVSAERVYLVSISHYALL